jgi:hypothetical protein
LVDESPSRARHCAMRHQTAADRKPASFGAEIYHPRTLRPSRRKSPPEHSNLGAAIEDRLALAFRERAGPRTVNALGGTGEIEGERRHGKRRNGTRR